MTDDRLDFMKYLGNEAGKIMLSLRYSNIDPTFKPDNSISTEADKRISDFVRNEISKGFPKDGFLEEESADSLERLTKNCVWIIDSLDGSTIYNNGGNDFCFLGGYVENGIPQIGVINEPQNNRMFFSQKGRGAYVIENGVTSKLKPVNSIAWEQLLVGHPKDYNKNDKYTKLYGIMGISEKQLIDSGSMGTRVVHVAQGKTHLVLGYSTHKSEWDIAAGHAILEEMGISVTDMFGNQLQYNKANPKMDKGILIVHPDIKQIILEKLAECYAKVKM